MFISKYLNFHYIKNIINRSLGYLEWLKLIFWKSSNKISLKSRTIVHSGRKGLNTTFCLHELRSLKNFPYLSNASPPHTAYRLPLPWFSQIIYHVCQQVCTHSFQNGKYWYHYKTTIPPPPIRYVTTFISWRSTTWSIVSFPRFGTSLE